MAQTIDLLKNSSFEQKMDSLTQAISNKNNDYNTNINKPSINGYTLEGDKTSTQLGIPVKLSDLSNDKNFIDNTVSNLLNYYNKSESYNKTEVNTLVNNIVGLNIKVVNVLPITNISMNTLYLILKESPNENNIYDEYININGSTNGWEKIGTTEVNLTNYYTKTEIDNKISNVPNVSTNDQTPTYIETTVLNDLTSGEKLSIAFGKLKLAVKNIKTLITLIGTTDISSIGGGTVTSGISNLDSRVTQLNNEKKKFYSYQDMASSSIASKIMELQALGYESGYIFANSTATDLPPGIISDGGFVSFLSNRSATGVTELTFIRNGNIRHGRILGGTITWY